MVQIKCASCKASLKPAEERVEFITCIYCRAVSKNPNYKEPINHTKQFQNNTNKSSVSTEKRPQQNPNQAQNEAMLMGLMSMFAFGARGRGRRSFRRRGRRRRGGCGCSTIIILALIAFIALMFRSEIAVLISQLINM